VLLRLLALARVAVELAKAEVAVRDERPHAGVRLLPHLDPSGVVGQPLDTMATSAVEHRVVAGASAALSSILR
jgi:hypothetical protein